MSDMKKEAALCRFFFLSRCGVIFNKRFLNPFLLGFAAYKNQRGS
jgi:hypothetical protein